jgi:transposase
MEPNKKRKSYDKKFKLAAVNLILKGERSVSDVARDLGIDANILYRWKRKFSSEGAEAFPGKGHLSEQDEELRRLRRELAQAQEDREILKKALGFFSKHGK